MIKEEEMHNDKEGSQNKGDCSSEVTYDQPRGIGVAPRGYSPLGP